MNPDNSLSIDSHKPFSNLENPFEPVHLLKHQIGQEPAINQPTDREKFLKFDPNIQTIRKIEENGFFSPLVKKFVQKLKQAVYFKRFTSLSKEDHLILNDLVFINEAKVEVPNYLHNKVLILLYIKLVYCKKTLDKLPVLEPYENFKLSWDILHFIVLNFLMFWVPIELCFDTFLPIGVNNFFLILFVLDIFVNMNTAYFKSGHLVKNRYLIYSRYIKHFLLWDMLTIVGFAFSANNQESEDNRKFSDNVVFISKIIFFLRFRNFMNIYNSFLDRINSKFNIKDSMLDLINLIYVSMFILHIFACVWYFIADIYRYDSDQSTWLTKMELLNVSLQIKYMYSLYWSSVTIMTVGYGDISPQNSLEIIFTIFAIFFGCGVVAYIISAIGNIMIEINKESLVFKYFFNFILFFKV